ncbi:MAG: hypothetical protein AB7U43_07055 [Desulfobacter sp.]
MEIAERESLKELVIDCKSELLSHALQGAVVSQHIKKIKDNLDRCLSILDKHLSYTEDIKPVNVRNHKITRASRENILFFAYCMSRFDAEFVNSMLGRAFNQIEAFDYLSDALDVKITTLRNYRDTFDPHVQQERSSRQGWKKELNDEFKDVIRRYNDKSEEELISIGKAILLG